MLAVFMIVGGVLILKNHADFPTAQVTSSPTPATTQGPIPTPDALVEEQLKQGSKKRSQYQIQLQFNDKKKLMDAEQTVVYRNNTNEQLQEVKFHLYPNTFKKKKNAPFEADEIAQAYPNGFSAGRIDFTSIKVEGRATQYHVGGTMEDILTVPLKKALNPGEEVRIQMQYVVKLPNSLGRFGYGEDTFNLANFYPVACVREDDGWDEDPYGAIGDPFYSDIADYDVTLTLKESMKVASTGRHHDEHINDNGTKTIHIAAPCVRDFAAVISEKFRVLGQKVGDVMVYSYYMEEKAGQEALDYAVNALDIFSRLYSQYPYPQFSVVQTDFFIGGMEYPNLVMIDQSMYGSGIARTSLEYVVVHETAHQWWYGLVGNDQVKEPWLDEALTEYSTLLYYRERYGEEKMAVVMDSEVKMIYELVNGAYTLKDRMERIDGTVYDYEDSLQYSGLVYSKGALMLDALRKELGDETYLKAMKSYFKDQEFKNASKADLIRAVNGAAGKDYQGWFDAWLQQEMDQSKKTAA